MSKTDYDGVVESVTNFIDLISSVKEGSTNTLSDSVSSMVFYRGQANIEWSLSPKLYRKELVDKEKLLISEFRRRAPSSFEQMSRFNELVKMQHFGLPTRLLDTTQNPLVALFFACYDGAERESDGAVYIFPQIPVSRPQSYSIKVFMKYVFEYGNCSINKNRFNSDVLSDIEKKGKDMDASKRPKTVSMLTVPRYAVLPSMANERISRQQGSFVLFGMREEAIQESDEKRYINLSPIDPKNAKELWHLSKTLRVPSEAKASILDDLSLLGVNEGSLFPELEFKAESVTRFVQRTPKEPPAAD